jgi:hypothetical protein
MNRANVELWIMHGAGGVNLHSPTWDLFRLFGNNDHLMSAHRGIWTLFAVTRA